MDIPLTGPAYKHPIVDVNYQRCLNYFVTSTGPGGRDGATLGKNQYGPLLRTSGLLSKDTISGQVCRQLNKFGNYAYAVFGNTVYKLTVDDEAGTVSHTSLGTIDSDDGRVYAAYNGLQILWVDGSAKGWIYNTQQNYVAITIGPIGGTAGDTYTLTLQGTAVYTAQNVAVALTGSALATQINTKESTTNVHATFSGGVLTLTATDQTTITVTESGTGFTSGTDGITRTGYDLATGSAAAFRQIVSTGFTGGAALVAVDGYFVVAVPDSATVQTSQLLDGTNWDSADVFTAESSPDNVVALAYAKGDLWVFGPDSIEIWYDAANASGSPFSKRVGFDISIGCGAPESVIVTNDTVQWVDNRGFVVQSDVSSLLRNTSSAYQLKIISDEAITTEILGYSRWSDATSCTYNDRGHIMTQFTFPVADKTWVFDNTTEMWHERSSYAPVYGTQRIHLIQFTAQFNTVLLAASQRDSDNIFFMSSDYLDDNGVAIHRVRSTAVQHQESKLVSVDRLTVRMLSGVAPQDTVPYVSLRYSTDGGHTWSNPIAREIGRVGEYAKMIDWNRLGYGREWILEFTVTDAVDHAFISASADIQEVEL